MRKAERQQILDVVEGYLKITRRDLEKSSIETYLIGIKNLMELYSMTEPTREQWADALAQMDKEGLAPATKKNRKQALVYWARAYNLPLDVNDINLGKLKKNRERVVTPDEEQVIIRSFPCLREKAAAALLMGCGMRISELSQLRVSEIDLKTGRVLIACHPKENERTKNGDDRSVFMKSEWVPHIVRWLKYRESILAANGIKYDHDRFIVRLRDGKPMKKGAYRIELYRQAKLYVDPNIGRHFHGKMGRRAFITRSFERGIAPATIQVAVGHKQLSTTTCYLNIDEREVARAYGSIRW